MKYIFHTLFVMSLLSIQNSLCSESSGSSSHPDQSHLTGYTSDEEKNIIFKDDQSHPEKSHPASLDTLVVGHKSTKTPKPISMHFGDLQTTFFVGKKANK